MWQGGFRLNLPTPAVQPPPDVDAAAHEHGPGEESGSVVAPMPGTVIKVLVAPGDRVAAREPLVVLEAMKMETPLVAPYAATVAAGARCARATAWPAARCSLNWCQTPKGV